MKPQELPKFPKTPHLLGSGAVSSDDVVSDLDFQTLMRQVQTLGGASPCVVLEEKLDGANVRIRWDGEGDPVVGNREKILRKGYMKDTPAKLQFRPLWGWVYEKRREFAELGARWPGAILYGEWMWAQHTIGYDRLPDWLVAFDLWVPSLQDFMDPMAARVELHGCGFVVPPAKRGIQVAPSAWGPEPAEGTYVKVGDGFRTVARYKHVRADFESRVDFNERGLVRNGLAQ